MPYTRLDFDRSLLNFRLFLKVGLQVGWGHGASRPFPAPPPLGCPEFCEVLHGIISGYIKTVSTNKN